MAIWIWRCVRYVYDIHDIHDIHSSPSWKKAFGRKGIFAGDDRGVALALCTDGLSATIGLATLCGQSLEQHFLIFFLWALFQMGLEKQSL